MAKNIQEALENLQHPDWKVRARAADDLSEGGSKVLDALTQALGDDSQFVRMAASRSLGRIADPKAVPALIRVLNDPVFIVRQNAMWSLGEIGDPSAIPAIQPFTTDQTMFTERAITVGQLAEIAIKQIEFKVADEAAAAGEADATAEGGQAAAKKVPSNYKPMSEEEREKSRAEALARKAARQAAKEAAEDGAG